MEIFLLLVVIVLLVIFNNSAKKRYDFIEKQVYDIRLELQKMRERYENLQQPFEQPTPTATAPVAPAPQETPAPAMEVLIVAETTAPVEEIQAVQEAAAAQEEEKTEEAVYEAPVVEDWARKKNILEKFFDKNPDIEKFIGENIINKVGILVLVLGIGFFVKYAIDQNWIGTIGRVAIGIGAGSILVGLAHRLRESFKAFSSVLVGGGLAVYYFTITIAFHEYHIFNQTAAFAIMVLITLFAVLLSVAYDRVELSVIALVGGFSSPFMLSSGEGNYAILFTYLLILNVGMLALAYFKKWNIVNILAFAFTVLLYGSWLATEGSEKVVVGGLIFATLFYLVFFVAGIINNIKLQRSFKAIEISMLMVNTSGYYGAGMYLLSMVGEGAWQGVFTFVMAVFNFVFAFVLFRNKAVDKNLVFLLIGIVLTFVSLTAPVQLKGNYITLFWALEAVLLLWFSVQSGIVLVKWSSLVVLGLMLFCLAMDWQALYPTFGLPSGLMLICLNKAFITGAVGVAALFAYRYLIHKNNVFGAEVAVVLGYVATAVLYIVLLLEMNYQLYNRVTPDATCTIVVAIYHYLFLLVINGLVARSKISIPSQLGIVLNGLAVVAYLTFGQALVYSLISSGYGYAPPAIEGIWAGYGLHFLWLALYVAVLVQGLRNAGYRVAGHKLLSWFVALQTVYVASMEILFTPMLTGITPAESGTGYELSDLVSQVIRIGFPILWGACSFLFIVLGMKRANKTYRIFGLCLLGITILKLFVFDLDNLTEGGRILAFIFLGVLLLVVSFLYQRIKKMIIDGGGAPATDNE